MKIICSKQSLIDNMTIVTKAVSARTTLPILECILLKADDNGLKMISNDLEMGIETNYIDSQITEQGNIAVDAKMFFEIIRKLPDNGEVVIEKFDNNIITIKCGKTEFKILGQNGEEFPVLPDVEKSFEYRINSNTLRNMIRQTIFSVAVDESKPVLTGELFDIEKGELSIVAVDGFRVSYRKEAIAPSGGEDTFVIVPSKTLNEIAKILPSDEDSQIIIYFTDKHILFQTDECKVVSRLLEGEFLKYKQIFTQDCNTVVKINRQEFIQSLERASLISRETKKNPVKLQIEEDIVKITSNTEMGTSYDELSIVVDGNPLEIAFNPKYLIDALKAIEDDEVNIQFTTPLSPCVIFGEEPFSYKYLVLPLRVK